MAHVLTPIFPQGMHKLYRKPPIVTGTWFLAVGATARRGTVRQGTAGQTKAIIIRSLKVTIGTRILMIKCLISMWN